MHLVENRPLADILTPFPAERILWARTPGDQVAVTHRGDTTIYDDPEALAAEVREHDREYQGLLASARDAATWATTNKQLAGELTQRAEAHLALAKATLEDARRRSRAALLLFLGSAAASAGFGAAAAFFLVTLK